MAEADVERTFWIAQGESVQGPFDADKIRGFLASGRLKHPMQVSADGKHWFPPEVVSDLLASAAQAPKIPPVAAPTPHGPTRPTSRTHEDRSGHHPGARGHHGAHGRSRRKSRTLWPVSGGALLLAIAVGIVVANRSGGDPEPEIPVGSLSSRPVTRPKDTATVVAKVEHSVALLRDELGSGTGFMVGDGVLVTNAHVVRMMLLSDVGLYFPSADKQRYRVNRLLYIDDDVDLCLLSVRATHRALPLAEARTLRRGQDLVLIGSPGIGDQIVENAISPGVAGPLTEIKGRPYLHVNAAVNPGNSGGPVLDREGRVVGMVTMKMADKEGMAFAVPAESIRTAIDRVRLQDTRHTEVEGKKQLAAAIYLRLELAGKLYVVLLIPYVEAIRRALGEGADTIEEVQRYLPDISDKVREVQKRVGSNLDRYIDLIQKNEWLDEATQEDLLDLQQIVTLLSQRAATREVISVINTLKEFDTLMGRYKDLCGRLRLRLGVRGETEGDLPDFLR